MMDTVIQHDAPGRDMPVSGLAGLLLRKLRAKCANLPTAFDLVLPNGSANRLGNGCTSFETGRSFLVDCDITGCT